MERKVVDTVGTGGEFGKGKKWSGGYVQVTTHLFFLFRNLMEK